MPIAASRSTAAARLGMAACVRLCVARTLWTEVCFVNFSKKHEKSNLDQHLFKIPALAREKCFRASFCRRVDHVDHSLSQRRLARQARLEPLPRARA